MTERKKDPFMSKKIALLLKLVVTVVFLFLCLRRIDISELPGLFRSINLYCLPYIFILNLLFVLLGAVNISILINSIKRISLLKVIEYYAYCWCLTLISPSQLGDVSLLLFFKKEEIPFHNTSSVYLIDKVITLFIYFSIAALGITVFLRDLGYVLHYFLLFILIGLLLSLYIILLLKKFNKFLYSRIIYDFFLNTIRDMISLIKNHRNIIFANFFLTCTKTIIMMLMYYMAFKAFQINVAPLNLLFITIIAALVAYLPISLGGVGVVEFCAIYLWSQLGVNEEGVLATYALLRLNNVVISMIIFAYFTIKFKQGPLNFIKQKQSCQ